MEPETLSPENAVKALALISAIPVVVLALWAEYFRKDLRELTLKKPDYDREEELEKIRIAGILGLLLQFTLFLAAGDIRKESPLMINLIFLAAIFLQLGIQSKLEKELRPAENKQQEEILSIAGKTALSWFLGLAIQVLLLFLSVRFGLWFGHRMQFTPETTGLLALLTGIMGVATGLFLNYACGPLYVRTILPHSPVKAPLLFFLKKCFDKTDVKTPHFSMIELEQFRVTTLVWVGLPFVGGPFHTALFISKWLINLLTPIELEAIIMNQTAHVSLSHVRKRFLLTLSLIVFTTCLALATVVLFRTFFPRRLSAESPVRLSR